MIDTWQALPNRSSGVEVANNTISTSAGSNPAICNAEVAAAAAWVLKLSLEDMTCLRLMPVLVAIQSSAVSTRASKSLLLRTDAGTLLPDPVSLQPRNLSLLFAEAVAALHCKRVARAAHDPRD